MKTTIKCFFGGIRIVGFLVAILLGAQAIHATSYGANLVLNGDAETNSLANWTNSGAVFVALSPSGSGVSNSPSGGNAFDYYPGSASGNESLSQIIDVTSLATDIAAGSVQAVLSGEVKKFYAASNGILRVQELDASNALLHTSEIDGTTSGDVWVKDTVKITNLNTNTRKLNVILYAQVSTSTDDYIEFDNIQLALFRTPTLTTTTVSTYGATSATLGGNVAANGGTAVTERGVVYSSTDMTPTIGESGVISKANGLGSGTFSESVASLSPSTTYYVQAYATNGVGTSYGGVVNFTTNAAAPAVTSVSVPTNGIYKAGDALNFTVIFDSNVVVTGSPSLSLALNTGGTVQASYVSGSGSKNLVFRYTVASGNLDNDGVTVGSLALSGGTIQTAGGTNASLTLNSVAATTGITVDALAPTISGVAPPTGGTYAFGQNLDFTATFTEAVTVVTTGGTPYMTLTIGGVTKHAVYTSGTGTTALTFRYTLASGDAGALATGTGITLSGGTIQDGANNGATLTFTAPTTSGITVDAVAPTISGVAPPTGGTYAFGQNLDFTATFTEAVTVVTTGGAPYMSLTIGGVTKQAAYVSGTGTTALTFRYTLASGDAGALATGSGITLSGGTIQDGANNGATLTFTAPTTSGITIDAVVPTISSVAPPAGGTYISGQNLDFIATFSKAVNVASGTPYITLTIGGVTKHAVYTSGSGTTALTFRYTLASGDAGALATGTGITLSGGTIQDGAGNNATLTFTAPTTSGITIDATAPSVNSFNPPLSGTYISGQNLDFIVNFSEAVHVDITNGTPYQDLIVGSKSVHADYQSGSGTSALVFRYVAAAGDYDADGVELVLGVTLAGGSITDIAGNPTSIIAGPAVVVNGLKVDAVAPTVATVAVPSAATYTVGQNLDFTVNFSKPVTVTGGIPYIAMTVGSSGQQVSYVSGSGTTALVFRYTAASGDYDVNGIVMGTSITLSGATLKDAAGNNATLTLGTLATSGINIDAAVPKQSGIGLGSNSIYVYGQTMNFSVNFNKAVVVVGAPYIAIILGSTTVHAAYVSGSGTKLLVFQYVIASGDYDADGADVDLSPKLNGGSIQDSQGYAAQLYTSSIYHTDNCRVDALGPTVSSVSIPAAATYQSGQNLDFTVHFSEATFITTTGGVPYLPLTLGGMQVQAKYVSGSGSTALVFRYTVVGGDLDGDGVEVGANLVLNGATIRDSLVNDATLSLSGVPSTANVLVDAVSPRIVTASSILASDNAYVDLTFSAPVYATSGGSGALGAANFSVVHDVLQGGAGTVSIQSVTQPTATTVRVFLQYTGTPNGTETIQIVPAGALALFDAVGDPMPETETSGALSLNDQAAPVIASVALPADNKYGVGDALDFVFTYSEPVTVTGAPVLPLTLSTGLAQAVYLSGSGSDQLTFRYVVQDGQSAPSGVTLALVLDLQGGSILDAAQNASVTDLPSVASAVGIQIKGVNEIPAAVAQAVQLNENQSVSITLSATDADGTIASYVAATPAHGSLVQTGATIVYTPDQDYFGADEFTFTAIDNLGAISNAATISLDVTELISERILAKLDPRSSGYALSFNAARGNYSIVLPRSGNVTLLLLDASGKRLDAQSFGIMEKGTSQVTLSKSCRPAFALLKVDNQVRASVLGSNILAK